MVERAVVNLLVIRYEKIILNQIPLFSALGDGGISARICCTTDFLLCCCNLLCWGGGSCGPPHTQHWREYPQGTRTFKIKEPSIFAKNDMSNVRGARIYQSKNLLCTTNNLDNLRRWWIWSSRNCRTRFCLQCNYRNLFCPWCGTSRHYNFLRCVVHL